MPRATIRRAEAQPDLDDGRLRRRVIEILNRHPAVGLALGVIRGGRLESFHGHGLADLESGRPITDDTAFRIGSVTKLFTAVAVMQLRERGLVDLDAPANEYLRAFRLRPARPGLRPVTIRHLLTHTSGIPDVRHPLDLLHFDWGPFEGRPPLLSVPMGEPLPRSRSTTEPGSPLSSTGDGVRLLEPRLCHARPDRRGRQRTAAGPIPPRAHLRSARHGHE